MGESAAMVFSTRYKRKKASPAATPLDDEAGAADSDGRSNSARAALRATRVQRKDCFRNDWPQPQSMWERPRAILTAMAAANSARSATAEACAQGISSAD